MAAKTNWQSRQPLNCRLHATTTTSGILIRRQFYYYRGTMHAFYAFLLPGVLCQFEMRPDVRFDEKNDRFDVSPLFDPGEYAEKEDVFRRSGGPGQDSLVQLMDMSKNVDVLRNPKTKDEKLVRGIFKILRQLARRSGNRHDSFAWHDDMRSGEEEQNYEQNLEQFRARDYRKKIVDYLHGGQHDAMPPSRRSGVDSDKEVLMHHALPISMKVKGYLQVPTVS